MTPHRDILETWARHWRNLKTWGRPLEEITVVIKGVAGYKNPGCGGSYSSGLAFPVKRRAIIRAGNDIADALTTILHEYAHLAAPGHEHHGPGWSRRYAAAVHEVTGIAMVEDGRKGDLDRAAKEALALWWAASGNAFAASLLMKGNR